MQLPLFYEPGIIPQQIPYELSEATAKHAFQVLRLQEKDQLELTDGRGNLHTATILSHNKKKGSVVIQQSISTAAPVQEITLAVSLLKNHSRLEWLLEKATEIGIKKFIPLICERTEKQHFRVDRFHNILISAMLQSRQSWLPELSAPLETKDFFSNPELPELRLIAHCNEGNKTHIRRYADKLNLIIAIGPEGDFTIMETEQALQYRFEAVNLGPNRLRTETAALTALISLASL